MMRLLGHFLAFVLAVALLLTAWAWAISRTVGSPHYLDNAATKTQLYENLAKQIPGADAAVINDQVHNMLPEFVSYFTTGGPAPTLDLPGVTQGPVALAPASPGFSGAAQKLRPVGTFAPFAMIGLIILILFVSGRHRWRILAQAGVTAAIGTAVSAGLLWLAPIVILEHFATPALALLKPAFTPFIEEILHGLAIQLAVAAISFLVFAVVVMLVGGILHLHARFNKPAKDPSAQEDQGNPRRPTGMGTFD
jgi:hypothetical protein